MTTSFDPETISQKVIHLVADAEDSSPSELTPLGTQIDTDALNILCSSGSNAKLEVRFEYEGYLVIIEESGAVRLDEVDEIRQ